MPQPACTFVMLVALRWMSQGGRSRHSLTLLLCTDCTAVWAPPLCDRVSDVGPISLTCVLTLMDSTALMYYVFHIVRSRQKKLHRLALVIGMTGPSCYSRVYKGSDWTSNGE